LIELNPVVKEASIFHEKGAACSATGIVEAVIAAGGGICREAGSGDFVPRSSGIANPLIAIESEAPDGSVVYRKILKERVETSKVDVCPRASEAGNDLPFISLLVAKPGGVNGGVVIAGLDAGKEAIGFFRPAMGISKNSVLRIPRPQIFGRGLFFLWLAC
jgi:hypothetical protein